MCHVGRLYNKVLQWLSEFTVEFGFWRDIRMWPLLLCLESEVPSWFWHEKIVLTQEDTILHAEVTQMDYCNQNGRKSSCHV